MDTLSALYFMALAAVVIVLLRQSRPPHPPHTLPAGLQDRWLDEVAVTLGELGYTEAERNTGHHIAGMPMEADIHFRHSHGRIAIYLFPSDRVARGALNALRARPPFRQWEQEGTSIFRQEGRLVLHATNAGRAADEPALREVCQALRPTAPPPPRLDPSGEPPAVSSAAGGRAEETLALLERLYNLHKDGALTKAEFEAKKGELLRRL